MTFEEEMEKLKADAIAEVEDLDNGELVDDNINDEDNGENNDTIEEDSIDDLGENDNSSDNDESENGRNDDKSGDDNSGDNDSDNGDNDFSPIDVDFAGQKITLKNKDELSSFLKRGAEALTRPEDTMKTEKAIIEQGQLNQDDLKLLVDIKNGDLNALAKLAESSKIDHLDIVDSSASEYKGTFEPTSPSAVEEVAAEIVRDKEHAVKFQDVLHSSGSNDFVNSLSSNADHLRSFSMHVKSGLAEKAMPEARTNFALYGGNFFEHYKASAIKIAQSELDTQPNLDKSTKNNERTLTEKEKELRKKASSNSTINKNSGSNAKTYDDVMDLSNEDFESLKRNIKK